MKFNKLMLFIKFITISSNKESFKIQYQLQKDFFLHTEGSITLTFLLLKIGIEQIFFSCLFKFIQILLPALTDLILRPPLLDLLL